MNVKPLLTVSVISLIALLGGGYNYLFIAGAPQLDPPVAEQNTGLSFQVDQFMSQAMGEERRYGLILPAGYAQHPQRHYPVIILLHGGHGSERDFEDKAKLTSILHDLYHSNRLPPSIIITPDGSDRRGSNPFFDPDYYDGPNGAIGTLITSELVQVIKSRYRVLPQAQFWAIGGLSSGGWGAFNLGLRHINQFHIFFSHTGYFVDKSGADNSPQLFIQQIPPSKRHLLRIYLDAGESDHKYLKSTQDFQATLQDLGIVNEFHIFPGGHGLVGQDAGWNYWHKHLADSLSFVGRQFRLAMEQPSLPTQHPTKPPVHHSVPKH